MFKNSVNTCSLSVLKTVQLCIHILHICHACHQRCKMWHVERHGQDTEELMHGGMTLCGPWLDMCIASLVSLLVALTGSECEAAWARSVMLAHRHPPRVFTSNAQYEGSQGLGRRASAGGVRGSVGEVRRFCFLHLDVDAIQTDARCSRCARRSNGVGRTMDERRVCGCDGK